MSESDSDDIYEVEQITNHVVCDGVTYYCVTWKGYEGPEAQTWEPKENLLSCEDLLNTYIANHEDTTEEEETEKDKTVDESPDESSGDESKPPRTSRRRSKEEKNKEPAKRGRGRPRGKGRGKTLTGQSGPGRPRRKLSSSSSSSRHSTSDESPHIKDPFWADLEMGKVNVFADDLYSKIKRRREGHPDEQLPDSTMLLPAVTSLKKRGPKKKSVDKDTKDVSEPKSDVEEITEEKAKSPLALSSDDDKPLITQTISSSVLEYLDDQLQEKKRGGKKKKEKNSNNSAKPSKEKTPDVSSQLGNEDSEADSRRESVEVGETLEELPIFSKETLKKPSGTKQSSRKKATKLSDDASPKEPPTQTAIPPTPSDDVEKVEKRASPSEEQATQPTDSFSNVLQQLDYKLPTILPKKDKKKIKKSLEKRPASPTAESEPMDTSSKIKPDEPKEKPSLKEPKEKSTSKEPKEKPTLKEPKEKPSLKEPKEKPSLKEPKERPSLKESKERPALREPKEKPTLKEPKDKLSLKEPKSFLSAKDSLNSQPAQIKEKRSSLTKMLPPEPSSKKDKEKLKNKEKPALLPPEKSLHGDKRLKNKQSASARSTSPTKSPSMGTKPAKSASDIPVPRTTDSFSVFEAMQKEFEASNFQASRSQTSPAEEDANSKDHVSSEVVNENVDMSEYLKVKVNFCLDEVSLKEIEQHHEAGEPPCRLGREVSNAEFRTFIRNNNYEMVFEVLKSKGRMYNLEHQDAMWMTQLMIASAAGSSEIVKALAHHGARVNARTKSNQTALMFAAEKGHAITVQILLMYGAYVNLQTSSGETALMKAVKGGHMEIAHCLLQAGADPCIKSPHGVSALNIEGRTAAPVVALVKKYKQTVELTVNTFVRQTLQQLGLKVYGQSLFGVKTFNVREHALIYFTYHCNLQDIPPNQGLVLFAVHGMTGPGLSVKCRMRGPCHVNAVTVNNSVMEPIMPSKEVEI